MIRIFGYVRYSFYICTYLIKKIKNMTKIKDDLIKEMQTKPYGIGEIVYASKKDVSEYSRSSESVECKILSINDDNIELECHEYNNMHIKNVDASVIFRDVINIGANPFSRFKSRSSHFAYSLHSIFFELNLYGRNLKELDNIYLGDDGKRIPELNWNPYIIDKNGQKAYYQRDFVWTLKDKQLLIESIYNHISIGKIVIRENKFTEVLKQYNLGNKEVCFKDIVDGKQRLNALYEFVNDKITDMYGNYYSDLSSIAQNEFQNYMGLSFYLLPEDTTDEETINEFLSVNFTGVQMSQEHINFVKSINLGK